MNALAIEAIRKLAREDELIETPDLCDEAVVKMISAARSAVPELEVFILEHPKSQGENHHKALLVENTVVNLSPTGLYPQFIGPLENAPATFKNMTRTKY